MLYLDAVLAFLVATAVAALLTPLAGRLARRVDAMAYPSDRGLASKKTPLLGGLAILAGVLIAAAIWMPDTVALARAAHSALGSAGHVHTWVVMAGAVLIALVGAIDDAVDLPPLVKLIGQIAAAIIAVSGGALINDLTIPFLGQYQFLDGGYPLTVIWLVALMNIVNFSDGVDGLAAGVCTIDGARVRGDRLQPPGRVQRCCGAGRNHRWGRVWVPVPQLLPGEDLHGRHRLEPARLSARRRAVIGSLKTNAVVALVVPLLVLAVPFLDTGFVVAKRLKYRQAPWHADAEHFHHRMVRIGFSQRKTVAYLYAWTVMLAGDALALQFVPYHDRTRTAHLPAWLEHPDGGDPAVRRCWPAST